MFSSRSSTVLILCSVLCLIVFVHRTSQENQSGAFVGHLVKRDDLRPVISTENGRVSEARVTDGNETFLLHFITLDPNSLFLPVLLHQDMVFYVHTGSGRLSYTDDDDDDEMETVDLTRGDVFRLGSGTVFFIQSGLDDPGRQSLRIHAIFGDAGEDLRYPNPYAPYSSIRDLVLGFDNRTLQEIFKVPEEVIGEIKSGPKPEAIMHAIPSNETSGSASKLGYEFIRSVLISRSVFYAASNKQKKRAPYNFFREKRDFENCNGWSTTVTKKKTSLLKNSKYGLFMVYLTHGAAMGPHWNPRATEINVVIGRRGMVRIVCPGLALGTDRECRNSRFEVEEGDVFVVPRFHPMAQMAFDNETFAFVGFSTSVKNNHPQYLAGKASVWRALDKHIAAISLGLNDSTFDRIMNPQGQSVILGCASCAEDEYAIMSEEIQREREQARRRKEEEAEKKREEEEREREEARQKEEEEAKRREEEAAQKKREEEERERQRQQEEEARRKREEEEREKQRQQEEQKRAQEEEARRRREEEERERQRQQEEERRAQEEREARQREEEEARRRREQQAREAEAERQAEEEREAAARREEEEAARRQEEEQEAHGGQHGAGGGGQPGPGGAQPGAGGGAQPGAGGGGQQGAGAGAQPGAGGGGQGQEGRGEQPPQEEGREAARQQEEGSWGEQQGGGTGWARRIMKHRS